MYPSFLKPLLFYKKYVLAEKILKACTQTFATVSSSANEPKYLTEKLYPNTFVGSVFLNKDFSLNSSRIIEAIDILEKHKHITARRNQNLYEFSISCTRDGEIAYNDGFYRKKIIKIWAAIISVPSVIAIITVLLKLFRVG